MRSLVLIVDDSLTVRMDLEEAFTDAGFTPTLCGDLATARLELAREQFVLVVLDILLPDGDGVDLLKELKENPATANIVVFLLSNEVEVADRIRGLAIGADDFVGKPYDCRYVIDRAHELLRNAPPEPESRNSPLVLVVDDSTSVREELRSTLESRGYSVRTAATGEDGLRIAAQSRPDVIVVDSQLPGIDGTTVIRRLRSDIALQGTPCLFLTASEERTWEFQSLEAGADSFVRKDEGTDVMIARLEAILRSATTRPSLVTERSLFGPNRILAVDDSLTYLQTLSAALVQDGYSVVPARSGEEALQLLAAQSVDCILLDLVMPEMSGDETCRRIKQSTAWRGIPVVMLTARDDREAMIEGFKAGADDFVCKSSEFELLGARLRAQLRRKQYEDENRRIRDKMLQQEAEAAESRFHRELADMRARLLEDLALANKDLEAFSYSVSHDLRAPLRAINGYTRILLHDFAAQLPSEAQQLLDSVRDNAVQMGRLIEDLLAFSRLGRESLRKRRVDLGELVARVLQDLDAEQQGRCVKITVGILGHCEADPSLLKQVLFNLIANAIKFTRKRDVALIEINRKEGNGGDPPIYFVKDNGAGFDPRYAAKLFGVFQRLHRFEDFEGTGVGLAIVQRIIQRHGGRVWAETELNNGATFLFTLERDSAIQTN